MLYFYLILFSLPFFGQARDLDLQKIVYGLADSNGLYIISLVEKKVPIREKFHIKARIVLKLEGDFDGFVVFLDEMADNHWTIGSQLEIKNGQPCLFHISLEQHALCQERFPECKD